MTEQSHNQDRRELKKFLRAIGGTSLIASSLLWTQARANESLVVSDAPAAIPHSVSPVNPPAATVAPTPRSPEPLKLAAPKVKVPSRSALEPRLKTVASEIPTIPPLSKQGKNSYIDTTSYSTSPAGRTPISQPSQVILTERRSGCQAIVLNGQLSRGNCGRVNTQPATLAEAKPQPPRAIAHQSRSLTRNSTAFNSRSKSGLPRKSLSQKAEAANTFRNNALINSVVSIRPIARQGLNIALEPITEYGRSTSPYPVVSLEERRTDLLFPLPLVASISSAFGWRVHPVTGSTRMHEGTDIAAPMGTPVLAAYQGEVAVADYLGGYGLTVVLRHIDGTQESRYAHLSEILVQPGEWVERGAAIGRVGSTGLSTGPHLHFEYRHLTPEGWVAVDAGQHLEYALENLLQSMQYAQLQSPDSLSNNNN